jgi:hypothetical protein
MKWDAATISRFAADAGFTRPDVHTATAIALAGSGGIDHYDIAAGAPGSGRYVGLWALNIDRWPQWSADELYAPERAAEVAYELTQRTGGFGWSAVWQAGSDRHWLDHAATAYGGAPFAEQVDVPIMVPTARARVAEAHAAAHTVLEHITRPRLGGH